MAAQLGDAGSILTLHRRLLALRRECRALHAGSYRPLDGAPAACFAYLRQYAGARKLIALNFSSAEQVLALTNVADSAQMLLSTHLDRAGPVDISQLRLRPNEGCLIELPSGADPQHGEVGHK